MELTAHQRLDTSETILESKRVAFEPYPSNLPENLGGINFVLTVEQMEFREILREPEVVSEIQNLVEESYQEELTLGHFNAAEMTAAINRRLCGERPLVLAQLTQFLELVSRAAQSSMEQYVRNRLVRRQPNSPVASTTTMGSSLPDSVLVSASGAGLTWAAAQSIPEIMDRKLANLRSLEQACPETAQWIRWIEFTGATTAEIAAYTDRSLEEVTEMVDLAVFEIVQTDVFHASSL